MAILRIQHAVDDFEGWKQMFDADPADRKGSGVRRYQVYRAVGDSNLVMIDLEFDDLPQAERLLAKMHQIWAGPGKAIMQDPQAWIVESVESVDL